jgi:hypothetical protein
MNWINLLESKIEVDGIKMTVTSVCKTCRKIFASDLHYDYYIHVDKLENKKIRSKKLKPLE